MRELRQSTAVTIYPIGPALDITDGATAETAIECSSSTIIDIFQANGTRTGITTTSSGGGNDMAHMANGYYSLELTGTDTSILGPLRVTFNEATALPFWEDFMILTPAAYDAKYVASKFPYSGTSVTNIIACYDGTGYNNANSSIGSVTTVPAVNIVAGALSAGAFAASAITGSALAASIITTSTFATGAISASAVGTGAITSAKYAAGAITASALGTGAITSTKLAAGTITAATYAAAAITASALGTSSITSAKYAAGAITASAFGAGAITSTVLAANAITASAVASSMFTNATFAAGAITASAFAANALTAGAIADDVVVAVSAGTIVVISGTKSTLDALTDGSGVTVTTNNDKTGYNLVAGSLSAGAFAANAITASAVAAGTIDIIWDEVISGHTTDGSFGDVINDMVATASGTYAFIASALAAAPSGGESAATIADAVWDEIITTHTADGSFGDMWNDMVATASGTYAYIASALANAPSGGESAATIADAVWDELRAGHTTAGSYGIDASILSAASIVAVSAGTIVIISGTKSTLDALTDGSGVTVTTNNDKTGYTVSTVSDKTGYSISGTKTTLDALTDGSGVTVTTNNDKTGYTVSTVSDKTGYSISGTKTTLDALTDGSGVTVTTNSDKAGYSISGTKTTLDALTDGSGGVTIATGAITSAVFAANAITASAVAAGAIDLIWDEVVDGTTTGRQSFIISNTLLAGKVSGGSSTTAVFRDLADTKNRITIIFTADGDKTTVTMNSLT